MVSHFNTVFFAQKSQCSLLLAPPAWGKTHLIRKLIAHNTHAWVLLFPLRSIVEEVTAKLRQARIDVLRINDIRYDLKDKPKQVLIGTPEAFLALQARSYIEWGEFCFVFDEFHLIYWWGEAFREKLLDCWEFVAGHQLRCIAMTATMRERDLDRWSQEVENNYDNSLIINIGMNRLPKEPRKVTQYHIGLKRQLMHRLAIFAHRKKKRVLIFLRTKKEIDYWKGCLQSRALNIVACYSGRSWSQQDLFQSDIILSTTVLGHGVNLPQIDAVALCYKLEIPELKFQLVGRAGRTGVPYELFLTSKKYRAWPRGVVDYLLCRAYDGLIFWREMIESC